jgi:hypothetical protein
MPTLPSGRRIEFSLDRFHALLRQMESSEARHLAETLDDPNDLLFVMDAVHFASGDGAPFFAGCVASDWATYAADWSMADRQALFAWFDSSEMTEKRRDAIGYIKALVLDKPGRAVRYPYALVAGNDGPAAGIEASRTLQ